MKNKFSEIISSLELPQEVTESIIQAWDAQVELNRKELQAELLSESSTSTVDMDYVVAAAETIMNVALEEQKSQLEAEYAKLQESNTHALNKVQKAKKLFEAAKQYKSKTTENTDVKLEVMSRFVQDVMAEEIKEFRKDREEKIQALSDERVKLLKERMNAQKLAEQHAKAASKLLEETLRSEIAELHKDRAENKKVLEARIGELEAVMEGVLTTELAEFSEDRKLMNESIGKLESLMIGQLTEELSEFQEDKRQLKEDRARLEADSKRKIQEFKDDFIAKTSESASKLLSETLVNEMTSLRQGLKEARENTFGRKIFEAFVGEFSTSVFSQNTTSAKLLKKLEESTKNIEKLQKIVQEQGVTLNNKEKELSEVIMESTRSKKIGKLTSSLSGVQKRMMVSLLESVQDVSKLEKEFDRYLPRVLEKSKPIVATLTEAEKVSNQPLKECKGNRVVRESVAQPKIEDLEADNFKDIEEIINSAGIAKKHS